MANAILASTCAGVTPWLALLGGRRGDGEVQGGKGEWAGGRGLCCILSPRACPSKVQKYPGQVDDGQSDNLCCCSRGDGDNRHMWFCWLIKHETGAKPAGLRRRGLTWPDQRMSPLGSQTVRQSRRPYSTYSTYTYIQTSPDRGASPSCRGPRRGEESSAGQSRQAGADKPAPPPCMSR